MASYEELRSLFNNSDLINRIDVAIIISANNLLAGTPTATEQSWAAYVFSKPRVEAEKALMAVLATNNTLTTAQITSALDPALQSAVDTVVPTLVSAFAGV